MNGRTYRRTLYVKYEENPSHGSEKKFFEFFQKKIILYVDIATYQIKQFQQKSQIMEGH